MAPKKDGENPVYCSHISAGLDYKQVIKRDGLHPAACGIIRMEAIPAEFLSLVQLRKELPGFLQNLQEIRKVCGGH